MLTFITGGCGSGKSTILMQRIREDIAKGREVIVLVPEQFSFEAEKKFYDFLGASAFNRMHIFSFMTLSRYLFREYGKNIRAGHYADDREKLVFLYQAVRTTAERGELQSFSKRSESSGFVEELLSLFVKLRKAGITADVLADAAANIGDQRLREKTSVIAAVLLEYDNILKKNNLYDSLTDLSEAAAMADIADFFVGKYLYLDEFDGFTGDQYGMLDVILSQSAEITCALRTDMIHNERVLSPIFEGGNRTFHRLQRMAKDLSLPVQVEYCREYVRSAHPDLQAMSTQLLRPHTVAASYTGHVHLAEAADPIAEAEYICAEIRRLLEEDKTLRCRDISIAIKNLDTYTSTFQRALERYNLPYHISDPKPILHTELIRHFLSLFTLLANDNWDTECILRYLKNPFSAYDNVAVSMLEHYCFTWSIDGEDWNSSFCPEEGDAAERAKPFGGAVLEQTRSAFVSEIQTLSTLCSGKNVREICTALYNHLCVKKEQRAAALAALDVLAQREFTTLWGLLMGIMDTIVSCSGDEVMEMGQLLEMFRLMIGSSHFSTPPQTLDCIQIVSAQTALLNAPKIVFVPEVCEGILPGEISLDGMFTRQELELLEEKNIIISRMFAELYSDERLIVHKLVSAPTEHLYLTYPQRNAAGEPVQPSVIVRQTEGIFQHPALLTRVSDLPLSFYVRTYASAYFHFVRALRTGHPELAALYRILVQHPDYTAKVRKLTELSATPDHRVSPESMQNFLGERVILSPSGIEKFYECPFHYFCRYCLRLYIPEKNAFSSRDVGNYAHYCLEHILRKYTVEQFTNLTQEDLLKEIRSMSDTYSEAAFSDALRRDGRFQLNYRMSGMGLLRLLQHMQKEMKGGKFSPIGFEVKLSRDCEEGTVPMLRLRDGKVCCDGKIDRIDWCQEGGNTFLRVVDYKTGERDFVPEKLAQGLDMQMPIYLLALRDSGIYENFVSGGVLYMPSGMVGMKSYQDREDKKKKEADVVLDEYYQMKGLLLDSAAVFMEPEIASSCEPVYDTGKRLYSVSRKQMEAMESHIAERICNMADTLYAGDVAPDPYCYPYSPCSYCECSDLCGMATDEAMEMTDDERYEAITSVFGKPETATEEEKGEEADE